MQSGSSAGFYMISNSERGPPRNAPAPLCLPVAMHLCCHPIGCSRSPLKRVGRRPRPLEKKTVLGRESAGLCGAGGSVSFFTAAGPQTTARSSMKTAHPTESSSSAELRCSSQVCAPQDRQRLQPPLSSKKGRFLRFHAASSRSLTGGLRKE